MILGAPVRRAWAVSARAGFGGSALAAAVIEQ